MNDTSSRSHSIFTITFVHAGFDADTGLPHETVNLTSIEIVTYVFSF